MYSSYFPSPLWNIFFLFRYCISVPILYLTLHPETSATHWYKVEIFTECLGRIMGFPWNPWPTPLHCNFITDGNQYARRSGGECCQVFISLQCNFRLRPVHHVVFRADFGGNVVDLVKLAFQFHGGCAHLRLAPNTFLIKILCAQPLRIYLNSNKRGRYYEDRYKGVIYQCIVIAIIMLLLLLAIVWRI